MQRAPLVGRLVCRDCDFRAVAVEHVSNLGSNVRSKTVAEDQQVMLRDGYGGATAERALALALVLATWQHMHISTCSAARRARLSGTPNAAVPQATATPPSFIPRPIYPPFLRHARPCDRRPIPQTCWMDDPSCCHPTLPLRTHRNYRAPRRLDDAPMVCHGETMKNFSLSVTLPPNDGSRSKASLCMTSPLPASSHTVASAPGVSSMRDSVAGRR